jgi:hypothetical protein
MMIPAGYMAKRVALRPDWIGSASVVDVFSVSGHVSEDFADYIDLWQHNGYWLFDSPAAIRRAAREVGVDLGDTRLFYYEVYERQFDAASSQWAPFFPERSFTTCVAPPRFSNLDGFDVVTFSVGTSPECSPLSCNSLAANVETNRHCLLDSFERAEELLERGVFDHTEPGPYRIFAVHSLPWPDDLGHKVHDVPWSE